MWKKYLIISIVIFNSPVIGGRRKKSDSTDCRRTIKEAFRYCTRSCSSDSDCKSNQKCFCDKDCGLSCVRNNFKCEALPRAKNSRQKSSNGSSFHSVVTYTCKPPFQLRGSSTRTCRATGKWDGKKARCRIMCNDPGDISNGNRQEDGFQAGKYIRYWCWEGYSLIGSDIIHCLQTGEWSAPKPRCENPLLKARCDPPKIPNSATNPRNTKKKYKYNDRVYLKCKDGFSKVNSGILSCRANGRWSGSISCSPKSCGKPKDVSNGKIKGYVYSFGSRVRYECNEGYKLNGPAYRTCQANQKWDGRDPTCEVVNCGPLDKPAHGDIIEQVKLTFGNRIVFECKDKGYEMKGSRTRICQSDGTWSGSPTTCEIVQCSDPGKLDNGAQVVTKGFVYGGSVTFTCDKDYTLRGTSTIYCKENKQWTASIPRCLAPCPDPGLPYQGNRIGDDFRHDKTVTFTCPRDYLMEGERIIRCSEGQWSKRKPSCKAPCVKLALSAHGWRSGEDFRHGASVSFFCRSGYTRVGASPITCNDGTWSDPAPVCKGICPRPSIPNKGILLGKKARFLDGDEVTYSCNSNNDLFGKDRIRCVGKKWDSSVPVCKARCSFSRRPAGGLYLESRINRNAMIKHGEKITYGCLGGYTMIGPKTQQCDNGRWTIDAPVCKASCPSPVGIDHGTKVGFDYRHGKTVSYQCDAEYTLKGIDRLTCNNGRWSNDPPECKAPCGNPGTPPNGNMQGNDFRHDSFVVFTCDRNYQLDGRRNIHCNDGTWSGSIPICVAVCPNPGKPSNGERLNDNFREGETVSFKCSKDHDLVGNKTIRCEGGAWSGGIPECKARCVFEGNPDNGDTTNGVFKRGDLRPHGSKVEYACRVSYTLVGPIVRYCDNGLWSTSVPSCKASCEDPGLLAEGRKNGNKFSHGKMVTFECTTPDYSLIGKPQMTCNDGSWDSEKPQCKATCHPLPALPDGKVNDNSRTHGALVSFSCNNGFQLEGSQKVICIDGQWNASSPSCKGFCRNPKPLKNGRVTGDDYSYGSSVIFECISGYDLHGPSSLTCNKGMWNGTIPACKKRCKDPGMPKNGWKLGENHSHDGSVQFRCKNKSFDLVGATTITCNEGEWSQQTPSCEARCIDPGIPKNGEKNGDDYRSRANVTFRCNAPLELIGSPVIFCQDGKWSNSKPTCSICARPLGLRDNNQAILISSPASSISPAFLPIAARLNGPSSWCPSTTGTYLQIDFDKAYKLTAIATQGGTDRNKWVERYTISFKAGAKIIDYTEYGSRKVISGNNDSSTVAEYKFEEPFVSSTIRIHPVSAQNDLCLRMELYGCYPNPDCVLVGSTFWGLWKHNNGAFNYYRVYITKLNATHLNFVLQYNNKRTRSYERTKEVLILDKIPNKKDISVNSSVIARHIKRHPEWYRSGTVVAFSGTAYASVKFDDDKEAWVKFENLRLVRRPHFCVNDM